MDNFILVITGAYIKGCLHIYLKGTKQESYECADEVKNILLKKWFGVSSQNSALRNRFSVDVYEEEDFKALVPNIQKEMIFSDSIIPNRVIHTCFEQ